MYLRQFRSKQFTNGLLDIDTMLNTQRALFAANDVLSQAELVHLQAIVSLYKALGGGWQKYTSQKRM